VGIAAGLANVEVTFTDAGLVVRTGWSRPSGAGAASGAVGQSVPSPWRAELVALERRLRAELSPPADKRASGGPDGVEVMRQVRSLIDASERRQQRELALRVADVAKDVRLQREADLLRIDRSQRAIQQETGLEVLRNREMLDYLVRTSQR
jgi:hypothetical protein